MAENNQYNSTESVSPIKTDITLFDALSDVFVKDMYCAQALTSALANTPKQAKPFITNAFYGVLDYNFKFDTVISALCERKPDMQSSIILKIGLYYLRYADMPPYAAVNRSVELSKKIPGVYSGFINGVLKKSIGFEPKFSDRSAEFAYKHNAPKWLCRRLVGDYSEKKAAAILDAQLPKFTHIRPIKGKMTMQELKTQLPDAKFTEYGCYAEQTSLTAIDGNNVTAQSLSSLRAVNAYIEGLSGVKEVLDICAAPGGKSVYLSELGNYNITACDIYPHKLKLIQSYAQKTGAHLNIKLNDATKLNNEFLDKFDLIIADSPCSGTGTLRSKPDILLRRKPSDVDELCELQQKILNCAAAYCKVGGVLCYSTCSILKCENETAVMLFLGKHKNYSLLDETKLLPDTDKCDGFYIARLKRNS